MSQTSKSTKLLAGLAAGSLAVGLAVAAIQANKSNLTEADSAAVSVNVPTNADINTAQTTPQSSENWIVSVAEAKALIEQGATILDARGTKGLTGKQTLEGAIVVTWQQFSQPDMPNKGKLLADDAVLSQKLQEVGVSNDRPVVVIADPVQGWGEDGRIVWMLRTLGHQQAVLVDGGYQGLVDAGVPVAQQTASEAATPGNFVVNRTAQWEIERDELRAALETKRESKNLVVIDVRERREYNGQTPYGEQRGGHVPGAIHIYYKDLLDQEGHLLSREAILAKLSEQGVTPDAEIVTYCTGGIRSGWFTSVLTDLGFQAKNYAGSMWEWASAATEQHPLTTQ